MTGILMMSVGNSYGSLPVNTVAPAVSGTATVGSTLTTTDGTWTGAPAPTFTYQWQRGTTNISGATSSTYVVQLGDVGNTVRCVVTATNTLGVTSANSANTGTVPLPTIGSALGGGFYAGEISVAGNGVASHYLVIGPLSSAQNASVQWKTSNTTTAGTSSVIDGPTNSSNMNNASHPAAQFCEGLTIGGFSDWYMPAKNELEVCYFNLKPTTTSNNTSSGTNTNAVPSRGSNYTSGTPARTSAAAFQSGGSEAFTADDYWSSTENSATRAWKQLFNNGYQYYVNKANSSRVRAVRRLPV
jgi:hypothetical protein